MQMKWWSLWIIPTGIQHMGNLKSMVKWNFDESLIINSYAVLYHSLRNRVHMSWHVCTDNSNFNQHFWPCQWPNEPGKYCSLIHKNVNICVASDVNFKVESYRISFAKKWWDSESYISEALLDEKTEMYWWMARHSWLCWFRCISATKEPAQSCNPVSRLQ